MEMVSERAKAMIADPEIYEVYNTFATSEAADTWLIKCAIASLVLSITQRL
jgi:hypothetical protein